MPPPRVNKLVAAISLLWLIPKREYLRRFRLGRLVLESVAGLKLVILPDVFNPVIYRTGKYFAEVLQHLDLPAAGSEENPRALDLGSGSGILAIAAAKLGYDVDAVDLNDESARCIAINASVNEVSEQLRVFHGDLYQPLDNSRYDLITFSPPSFRGEPQSRAELCWRSRDIFERFAKDLPQHLAPTGTALVLQTSHGDEAGLLTALDSTGLAIELVARKHYGVEILSIYGLSHVQ